jgi:hypothetical protein
LRFKLLKLFESVLDWDFESSFVPDEEIEDAGFVDEVSANGLEGSISMIDVIVLGSKVSDGWIFKVEKDRKLAERHHYGGRCSEWRKVK